MIRHGNFKVKNDFTLSFSGTKVVFEEGEIVEVIRCKKEGGLCVSSNDEVVDIPRQYQTEFLKNVISLREEDDDYEDEESECDCDCEDPDCECEECFEYVDADTGDIVDPSELGEYEIITKDENLINERSDIKKLVKRILEEKDKSVLDILTE